METVITFVSAVSVLAVIPAFAAAIYAERKVAQRLRNSHPILSEKIAPHPLAEASLSSPFARFITQRRYLELGDTELSRLGERARTSYYLAVSIFLALVLSLVGGGLAKQLG